MCTLSWIPEVEGYTVCFNRDERRSRTPGGPPIEGRRRGVAYLAPSDGDFGGSWIGVNVLGVTHCLANQYPADAPWTPPAAPRISRGLLLASILDSGSGCETGDRLERGELQRYEPFTIAVAEPGSPMTLHSWNGRGLESSTHGAPGLVLTSSSALGREVVAARERTFREATDSCNGHFDRAALRTLHASHLPARGAHSVCMHRDDAETVSFSLIRVLGDRVTFNYVAAAPCSGRDPVMISLERAHRRAAI